MSIRGARVRGVGVGLLCGAALSLLAAAAPQPARAQSPGCADSAPNQAALEACAANDAHAADQMMTQSYNELVRYLDPEGRAKLVASQKAWLAYRGADCGFWSGTALTMSKLTYENCMAQLTTARSKELDSWPPNASRDSLIPQN